MPVALLAHRPGNAVFSLSAAGELSSHELPALDPRPVRLFPLVPTQLRPKSMAFNASGSLLAILASNAVYLLRFPVFISSTNLNDALGEDDQLAGTLGNGSSLRLSWHGPPSASPHLAKMKSEWAMDGRVESSEDGSVFSGSLRGIQGASFSVKTSSALHQPFDPGSKVEWMGTVTVSYEHGIVQTSPMRLVTLAREGGSVIASVGRVSVSPVEPFVYSTVAPLKSVWLPDSSLAVLAADGILRLYDVLNSLDAPQSQVACGSQALTMALHCRPSTKAEEAAIFVLHRSGKVQLLISGVLAELCPAGLSPDARNGQRSQATAIDLWVGPIANSGTVLHRLWSCGRVDCLAWAACAELDVMIPSAATSSSSSLAMALSPSARFEDPVQQRREEVDSPLVDMNSKIRQALALRSKPAKGRELVVASQPVLVRCLEVWGHSAPSGAMRMLAVDADRFLLVRSNELVVVKALWIQDLVEHAEQGINLREIRVASRRIALNLNAQVECTLAVDPAIGLQLICCDGSDKLVEVDIAAALRFITTDNEGKAIEDIDEAIGRSNKTQVPEPFAHHIAQVRAALDSLGVVPPELCNLSVTDGRDERLLVSAVEWLQETKKALVGPSDAYDGKKSVAEAIRQGNQELAEARQKQKEVLAAQKLLLQGVQDDLKIMAESRAELAKITKHIAELDGFTRAAATSVLQRARSLQPKLSAVEIEHIEKLRELSRRLGELKKQFNADEFREQVANLGTAEENLNRQGHVTGGPAVMDPDAEALAMETDSLLQAMVGGEGTIGRLKARVSKLNTSKKSFCVVLAHERLQPPRETFSAVRVEEAILSRSLQAALRRSLNSYVPVHINVDGNAVEVILLDADVMAMVNKKGELLLTRRADAVTREVLPVRVLDSLGGGNAVVQGTWRVGIDHSDVAELLATAGPGSLGLLDPGRMKWRVGDT